MRNLYLATKRRRKNGRKKSPLAPPIIPPPMPTTTKFPRQNQSRNRRNGRMERPSKAKTTHPPLSPRIIIPLGNERNPRRPSTQTPQPIPTSQSNHKKVRTSSLLHRSPKTPTIHLTVAALIYVYSQSNSPDTWKFNKARQNWIIRNVWTSKVGENRVWTISPDDFSPSRSRKSMSRWSSNTCPRSRGV